MSFWNIGKGLLKLIPGVGNAIGLLDTVGDIAEAIGGETGRKIKEGLGQVSEGLQEVQKQPLSPEQQVQMGKITMRHKERMAAIDLKDTEGGRKLATVEINSEDEYVRRTRPMLLRWYGKGTFFLIFTCILVVFISAFTSSISKDEAQFIVDVLKWALPSVSGTFLFMYRAYTGKRTQEKLARETGMLPETTMDKVIKFAARR